MAEIPVSELTDGELAALEASGVSTSGPVVSVPDQKIHETPVEASDTPEVEKKPIEAPPPSKEVVERVRDRIQAQGELEGSSYEHRDTEGNVVEKVGNPRAGEPEEDIIDAADKQAFLAHILGGQRFSKTYRIFGGKLSVVFQTRTTAEDETCANQAFYDEQLDGGYSGNTIDARTNQRLQRYYDYQFIVALRSIQTEGSPPRTFSGLETPPGEDGYPLRKARADINNELSQPLKTALRAIHAQFEALVARLTGEANSKDFWQAGSDT